MNDGGGDAVGGVIQATCTNVLKNFLHDFILRRIIKKLANDISSLIYEIGNYIPENGMQRRLCRVPFAVACLYTFPLFIIIDCLFIYSMNIFECGMNYIFEYLHCPHLYWIPMFQCIDQ